MKKIIKLVSKKFIFRKPIDNIINKSNYLFFVAQDGCFSYFNIRTEKVTRLLKQSERHWIFPDLKKTENYIATQLWSWDFHLYTVPLRKKEIKLQENTVEIKDHNSIMGIDTFNHNNLFIAYRLAEIKTKKIIKYNIASKKKWTVMKFNWNEDDYYDIYRYFKKLHIFFNVNRTVVFFKKGKEIVKKEYHPVNYIRKERIYHTDIYDDKQVILVEKWYDPEAGETVIDEIIILDLATGEEKHVKLELSLAVLSPPDERLYSFLCGPGTMLSKILVLIKEYIVISNRKNIVIIDLTSGRQVKLGLPGRTGKINNILPADNNTGIFIISGQSIFKMDYSDIKEVFK